MINETNLQVHSCRLCSGADIPAKPPGSHLNRSSMSISKTIKPLNSAIICLFPIIMHTYAPSGLLEIAPVIETREPSVCVIINRMGGKNLIPGKIYRF